MLYHLLFPLRDHFGVLNVFRYLTFRSMMAFFTAIVLVLILQPRFIDWLKKKQFGDQPIREDGPESHLSKQGTPTMGGLVVVASVLLSTLLYADLTNIYIWVVIGLTLAFSALGFLDDFKKVSAKDVKGISAGRKILWEVGICVVGFSCLFIFTDDFSTAITVPFFKDVEIDFGWLFVPFATLVVVGCANAVNLTDGLDGLVIGPIMTVAFAYGVFAYVSGNVKIAKYLQISYISGCGELSIFAAAIIAGGLGFLWFNAFPAQVFMGDVGSLGLGSALGALAVVTKQELILVVAGGVFVLETLSVIVQVGSFKLTGKRVFRMAPLHHHFELKGLAEPKIIVRCWIISFILALLSLATLKLR